MEEKKISNNQPYYDSDCFFYSLEDFENFKTLGEPETKVALRSLKYHLENSMGFEMSDELFEEIFMKIPYLRPLHPLGCGCAMLGFIRPLQHVLQKRLKQDINSLYEVLL